LGGPKAPNSVESVLPEHYAALIDDGTTGKLFCAQDYAGKQSERFPMMLCIYQ